MYYLVRMEKVNIIRDKFSSRNIEKLISTFLDSAGVIYAVYIGDDFDWHAMKNATTFNFYMAESGWSHNEGENWVYPTFPDSLAEKIAALPDSDILSELAKTEEGRNFVSTMEKLVKSYGFPTISKI